MVDRSRLSPTEKYLGFEKAHDTFRAYRERGEFLAAYVVAFSIFEDRVRGCYLLAHDLARKSAPPGHSTHYKRDTRGFSGLQQRASREIARRSPRRGCVPHPRTSPGPRGAGFLD
jgi:hypothetical protein